MTAIALLAVVASSPLSTSASQGQSADAPLRQVIIPYLANATKRGDLDFTAAECDLVSNGEEMACRLRQVFLTPSSVDPTTCMITTNGYQRIFRREGRGRWISRGSPEGDCGLVETTTLEDGGGTRWTMTIRTAVTRRTDEPKCRAVTLEPEVYDWLNLKRALPCATVQPGAIER